jgi:hypothetical protein
MSGSSTQRETPVFHLPFNDTNLDEIQKVTLPFFASLKAYPNAGGALDAALKSMYGNHAH